MISGSNEVKKILVQCDFDGTITEEDQSFLILDAFANGNWRPLLTEYRTGKIPVGEFNTRAFTMVKEDKGTLVNFVSQRAKLRDGFHELLGYCRRHGFRFIIVSNGLDFYIDTVLNDVGVRDVEVLAAQTEFDPRGMKVAYIGPDGSHLEAGLKEAHIRLFLKEGYRVIYVGNGISDISAAEHAHHVFAREELLDHCKRANLNHTPFTDFNDVIEGLELLR